MGFRSNRTASIVPFSRLERGASGEKKVSPPGKAEPRHPERKHPKIKALERAVYGMEEIRRNFRELVTAGLVDAAAWKDDLAAIEEWYKHAYGALLTIGDQDDITGMSRVKQYLKEFAAIQPKAATLRAFVTAKKKKL